MAPNCTRRECIHESQCERQTREDGQKCIQNANISQLEPHSCKCPIVQFMHSNGGYVPEMCDDVPVIAGSSHFSGGAVKQMHLRGALWGSSSQEGTLPDSTLQHTFWERKITCGRSIASSPDSESCLIHVLIF